MTTDPVVTFEVRGSGTDCPTCGERTTSSQAFGGQLRFAGSFNGENRWVHRACGMPEVPTDAQRIVTARNEELRAEGARAERERIVKFLREVLGNWEPECSGCDSFEAFEDAIDHVRGGMQS